MLDQSMPTDEGGKSRLANVVAALNARLQALPPSSAVGLWTFDGTDGRSEVSTGPLSDPVNGQPRSAALTSALNSQTASGGGAVSFTTLRLVYTDVMANFRQGQNNSILVITAGPHTDQSLDGPGLQQYIRGAFDQARPVAVNVIDFGNDSDRATWEAVAQASGGTYQNLGSSARPGAHHGDRDVPGLVRRRCQQAQRSAGEDLGHLDLRIVPDPRQLDNVCGGPQFA